MDGRSALVSTPGRRRQGIVAVGGELVSVEDRFVPGVDLAVARDPLPQPRPARRVRADGVERFGRRAQLAGDLSHEVPEHVLLAGKVLIEGHARAASERRDPLDAAPVVPLLAERPERGVEDPLLRSLPPRPDLRVVGKRGPPSDRERPAGPPVSIVIGHRPMLARNDMAVRFAA